MEQLLSERKKERERHFLRHFLLLSNISAEIIEEREAPDFLLRVDARTVGLEVTEVYVDYDGSSIAPRARESIVARVVADARHRYEELGGKPLHVSIGFSPRTDLRTLDRTKTATALAQCLFALDAPVNEVTRWKPSYTHDPLLMDVLFINAYGVANESMAHWYSPQAGWIAPLTKDLLQARVDEKAKKLTDYQRSAPEAWLLLAVAGGAPSQGFDRLPDIQASEIRSPFSKTYFLSLIEGTVQELGVPKR